MDSQNIIYIECNKKTLEKAKEVLEISGIEYKEDESLLHAVVRQDITDAIINTSDHQGITVELNKDIIDIIVDKIVNADEVWASYDEILNEESSLFVMEKIEEQDTLNDDEEDF